MTCQELQQQFKRCKNKRTLLIKEFQTAIASHQLEQAWRLCQLLRERIKEIKIELIVYKVELARQILGDRFLGPEAVGEVFGMPFDIDQLPLLPLSRKDLEIIKGSEQLLILRINQVPDGQPLTLKHILGTLDSYANGLVVEFSKKNTIYDIDSVAVADILASKTFSSQTPKLEWVVVDDYGTGKGKSLIEALPDIANRTGRLLFDREKLKRNDLPIYRAALEEYRQKYFTIIHDDNLSKEDHYRKLTQLALTQLALPSTIEMVYDFLLYWWKNKKNPQWEDPFSNSPYSTSKDLIWTYDDLGLSSKHSFGAAVKIFSPSPILAFYFQRTDQNNYRAQSYYFQWRLNR